MEGTLAPKFHPNLVMFNITRFNPFYALVEVLMGVVAARFLMTEDVKEDGTVEEARTRAPILDRTALKQTD